MYAFLVKKISISQNIAYTIAWNKMDGYIAVGGCNGFLKIVKLEDKDQPNKSINSIPLQLHKNHVRIVCWNQKYKKLTSADDDGLIIVWILHNGKWFQQMINNRNKSVVSDMKWSPDGNNICIIYLDGAIIMGSVEGNRLWGKQNSTINLCLLEWSPDSRFILLGNKSGSVLIYHYMGDFVNQIKMIGLQRIVDAQKYLKPDIPIAAIEWFQQCKMYTDDSPLGLCISYQVGRIILMKHQRDDDPLAIDCSMKVSKIKWNPSGTIFAVAGTFQQFQQTKGVIKFFDSDGNHLKNLKLPNSQLISSISWQGTGLRMAIGCGNSVYIASIKPNYKWAFLSNEVVVFAYQKSDRIDFCVIFWNAKTNEKIIKYVKNLCELKGEGQYCALFYKEQNTSALGTVIKIELCNSIGTSLQTKYITLQPIKYAISKTHILVYSEHYIYLWHYKNLTSKITAFDNISQLGLKKIGRETCWFVNDTPDVNINYDRNTFDNTKQSQDVIFVCSSNQNILLVGKQSGVILKYTLPHINQQPKLFWKALPQSIYINLDSTKIALTDISGALNILEINNQGGTVLQFEKKDCWSFKWSEDHPSQFAYMQKAKLSTCFNLVADPHLLTDAYICQFKNLKVKCIYLDDVIKSADGVLSYQEIFFYHETSILTQFMEIYTNEGIKGMCNFAQQFNHSYLWEIIAQKSLEELDFKNAQRALLKSNDYKGLKLIKKIESLDDKEKQHAEVLAFYGKYDQAEQIYRSMQRKDLVVQMRMRIGDWHKVLQMVKEGTGYDDILIKVYENLGHFYSEKNDLIKSAEYFFLAKNYKELVEIFVKLENYQSLSQIIEELPENDPLLLQMAERFKFVGLAQYAVKCYQRCGQIKVAIDCCVLLNQWDIAVQLAEKHGFIQIQGLLSQYANQLLQQNKKLEVAELYRKANHNTQAAKILSNIANNLIQREETPLVIKKLYVMAALQVDLYKKRLLDATMTGQTTNTSKTLDSLITSDINTSSEKILNNPWRGAQAWHFYILCQKHLYNRKYKLALKTALRLTQYQLQIDAKKIYSLVALSAYYQKFYKECSRAFFKLEGLTELSFQERQKYQQIAVSIFTKHQPKDGQAQTFICPSKNCKAMVSQQQFVITSDTNCRVCGSNFQPCVLSGRSLVTREYYTCKACRHKMADNQMQNESNSQKFCALCHSQIDYKRFGINNEQIL